MKRRMQLAAAIVVATLTATVEAQPPSPLRPPPRQPAYSPYLNLTRPGGGPAQNYYGLVRPELEFRKNVNQLRQETGALAAGLTATQQGGELETGHSTGYMTHLRYFGTNGGAAAGRGGAPRTGGRR
jgi:hypothetical protein